MKKDFWSIEFALYLLGLMYFFFSTGIIVALVFNSVVAVATGISLIFLVGVLSMAFSIEHLFEDNAKLVEAGKIVGYMDAIPTLILLIIIIF